VIVEADFRRPIQSRLLGLTATRGLTEVLAGSASIAEAMQTVPASEPVPVAGSPVPGPPIPGAPLTTTLAPQRSGAVSVLVGSNAVANPPALMASASMGEVLRSLSDDYDRVLIDAPSPLEVGDVVPLLAAVDAIVIVTRVGYTREASARRLVQLLMRTPSAPVIGVVANAVAPKDSEKYGISPGSHERSWLSKLTRR
jgi:Mrp family chromosome partitioning ATPase